MTKNSKITKTLSKITVKTENKYIFKNNYKILMK